MEFVILCGGYGTRFQDVSKILPKILINISKSMTMLDWIMEEYLPINSKVILATGHLHKTIYNYVYKKSYRNKILFSEEKTKLGTGGAIINATSLVHSKEFIVLNGDTIQEVKMADFLNQSALKDGAIINIGCSKANNNDSGRIIVNSDNLVINFSEKKIPSYLKGNDLRLCSSLGMYRCSTAYFQKINKTCISLEEELLPKLVEDKKVFATVFDKNYHDFGTLERYQKIIGNNL